MRNTTAKNLKLRLPYAPKDPILLADWLEILALISPDGNSSDGELERALQAAAIYESDDEVEVACLDTFRELEERAKAAKQAYPFTVKNKLLKQRGTWQSYPAYVFCLCLSYFGCPEQEQSKAFPRRWFEHLSRDAAMHYLGREGKAVRFGSPRLKEELPKGFKDSINKICNYLNEGKGFKGKVQSEKDDYVDIIAWKHFPDELPGKLIMFGNCASQIDWDKGKARELYPDDFCRDWLIEPPRCKIIKSLFIPHRPAYDQFIKQLGYAGIIFDRCRIAYWSYSVGSVSSQKKQKNFFIYDEIADWAQKKLTILDGK